jgi:hypothetical protein
LRLSNNYNTALNLRIYNKKYNFEQTNSLEILTVIGDIQYND